MKKPKFKPRKAEPNIFHDAYLAHMFGVYVTSENNPHPRQNPYPSGTLPWSEWEKGRQAAERDVENSKSDDDDEDEP
jgi:hypothetical protein